MAQRANRGELGCGAGQITIVRTDGTEITVESGLDPIHVFGERMEVGNLLELLRARARANRIGEGALPGNVSDLLYVTLYTLGKSGDSAAVSEIAPLATDPNETIRARAQMALIELGTSDPRLRLSVRAAITGQVIDFRSAQGRGAELPEWLRDADVAQ